MKRRFLYVTLALFACTWLSVCNAETQAINQFSGLNTDDSPLTLSNGQTPDSENVLDDDGPGLQGRKGFVSFATQTPVGMWEFPKSDGTRYLIVNTGTRLLADTGAGTFQTLVSTVPADRTVAASVLGDRFYFADTLNGLKYWDSTTVFVASGTMKVDKLCTWKGRLVAAGITASQRVIFLSKYLDGTSWTAPINPSDDDAAQITVAGALDENIQALFASFKDILVWFKKNSFGGIYGSRRSNFSQRTFSDYVGVSSVETIRDCDGLLRWLGNNRKVWEFDGATFNKISEDIDNIFATVSQGDSSAKSNTQTTEAQFEAGTQSPTGFLDTVTTPGSLTPKTTSFTDTASSDFDAGTQSPAGWFDGTITAGSYQLATSTAINSFVDTSSADFSGGTLVNGDTTTFKGEVHCKVNLNSVVYFLGCSNNNVDINSGTGRQFTLATSSVITGGGFTAGYPTQPFTPTTPLTMSIRADSANTPGTVIISTVIANFNSTNFQFHFNVSTTLAAGTYWLYGTGGNTDGAHRVQWVKDGCSASTGLFQQIDGGSITNNTTLGIRIISAEFPSTATLTSRAFDNGFSTNTWLWNWSTLSATQGQSVDFNNASATGGSISFQTQTSPDSSTWDSAISVANGGTPTSTVRRYYRYVASLAPNANYSVTPALSDVTQAMSTRIRPAAVFTSRSFDTGLTLPVWGLFASTVTAIAGGGVGQNLKTQVSADNATWDAGVAATNGTKIGSSNKRYFRYVWSSTASSITAYDRLDEVAAYAKSTGTFTTSALSIGSQITAWGPLSASFSTGGGNVTMQFSTSTNGVTFSSWTTISNNTTPAVSTAPFAAVRFLFDLSVATNTPSVDDVTINWTEGSTVRAASAYSNQRYWLAVAIGATTNNRVLIFDKKRQWQRYNGINIDACTLYNSKLYFGNSTGIYNAENGYSDNTSPIASYYRTTTLAPNKLDLNTNFDYLYMTTDPSDSTLTTSFQINGIPTDYSMGSFQMNSTTGFQNFKLPFGASEVQTGKNISFKWSVSGTSFWRISNGTLYHQPLALPE